MENSMEVPLKTKNRPYDPAIPLLGWYLDKTINWKDTCTLMFTATLCTKTNAWKHPVSTERRMDKEDVYVYHTHTHTHTHNGMLLSHENQWNNVIYSYMDGPRDYHIEWSMSNK